MMRVLAVACIGFLSALNATAAPGHIILFNGTSSAGKSSLAEAMIEQSKRKYEVVSFDEFHRSYREKHGVIRLNQEQYQDFRMALYRHARTQSDAGHNVIIDTVEFDMARDRYCEILGCSNVVKTVVYCPLDAILKRIDKRNNAEDLSGRRPVLLAFRQFLQMYKLQTSSDELIVEKTHTKRLRTALVEAGMTVGNSKQFQVLYADYVKAFNVDKDEEIVVVPKGRYDLAIDTRANTKKENVRTLEEYVDSLKKGKPAIP